MWGEGKMCGRVCEEGGCKGRMCGRCVRRGGCKGRMCGRVCEEGRNEACHLPYLCVEDCCQEGR